ncbi:uncharacterized protein [Ranitomeya imitator]|uniref:uncharacterized protein n=1 Tax=Ranitomeya imitator TaxID=111125 RepID=UPI0037E7D7AB
MGFSSFLPHHGVPGWLPQLRGDKDSAAAATTRHPTPPLIQMCPPGQCLNILLHMVTDGGMMEVPVEPPQTLRICPQNRSCH